MLSICPAGGHHQLFLNPPDGQRILTITNSEVKMIDKQTTMGAVTLRVNNLEKATRFYLDVIGLDLLQQTAESATLGTPLRPLVHLRHLPHGRFLPHTTGLYHLALRVPTRQALANWFNHYSLLDGPHWQGSADHGVSNALYLSDSEGNGLEVYWDLPRAEWPRNSDGSLTMYTHALDLQDLLNEANDWSGMPQECDMGQVHLKTAAIPTARQFYVDVLGFESVVELPDSALFIGAGGYHHHIGLNTWHSRGAPSAPPDAFGLAQFEVLFASQSALQRAIDRLEKASHMVEAINSGYKVQDPSHIAIILKLDRSP
jgi:catechol 2,3-dioxygenase